MATSIVGIADEDTEPIEPPTARISYLSQVGVNSTMKFNNFVDAQLNPISVTTDESHVAFVTLFISLSAKVRSRQQFTTLTYG